nr:ketosteroid isomerase-related protein [Rhodoligotrophos defluvii]
MTDARIKSIQLVTRYYDAFNRGDIEGMLACLADDVVHDVNQGGQRQGKALFREFCEHMARCYKEHLDDLVVMASDDGRHAAASFTVNGQYLATDEGLPPARGQTYRLPAGGLLEIADGAITRIATHYNLNDWIAQVEGRG